MTTDGIMNLAYRYACARSSYSMDERHLALKAAVDTLVAERDALRTERDTLRQVIEQQLLNVPVGEWTK